MNVRLVWIGNPLACEIRVSTEEFVIGRDRSCHLRIDHPQISPRHCRIVTVEQRVWLEDLATLSPPEVNDRLVRATEVKHLDRVRIGPAQFTVSIEVEFEDAVSGLGQGRVQEVWTSLPLGGADREPAKQLLANLDLPAPNFVGRPSQELPAPVPSPVDLGMQALPYLDPAPGEMGEEPATALGDSPLLSLDDLDLLSPDPIPTADEPAQDSPEEAPSGDDSLAALIKRMFAAEETSHLLDGPPQEDEEEETSSAIEDLLLSNLDDPIPLVDEPGTAAENPVRPGPHRNGSPATTLPLLDEVGALETPAATESPARREEAWEQFQVSRIDGNEPSATSGQVRLIVQSGRAKGRAIEVTAPLFAIGRDSSCQLRCSSPTISRTHAVIERREDGVFVRDAGSFNGTKVNNRWFRSEEVEVVHGDRLEVPPLVFTFAIGPLESGAEEKCLDPSATNWELPETPSTEGFAIAPQQRTVIMPTPEILNDSGLVPAIATNGNGNGNGNGHAYTNGNGHAHTNGNGHAPRNRIPSGIHLKVIEGRPLGARVPLAGPDYLIGRSRECQLRPRDESIGPQHCRLAIRRGRVKVYDLGIASGTLLNGNRLAPAVATRVTSGDRLRIGNLTFEFVIPPVAKRPRPTPWDENLIASLLADISDSEPEPDLDLETKDPLTLEPSGGTLVATIELIQVRDEESTALFREALAELTDLPDLRRVVLDFQHVKVLGPEAGSALALLHQKLKAQRVAVELCDVVPRVLTVLAAHGLGPDQLPVHFDRDGALLVPWAGRAAVPALASVGDEFGQAIQIED